jgi:hypothetical protein
MPDYSKHRLQNWEWCHEYRSRMGVDVYEKYIDDIYRFLLTMHPAQFFSIEKNVKQENIDLFIKVCCMFILEQSLSSNRRKLYHTFNPDYTEIRCVCV